MAWLGVWVISADSFLCRISGGPLPHPIIVTRSAPSVLPLPSQPAVVVWRHNFAAYRNSLLKASTAPRFQSIDIFLYDLYEL
jgi:hypothetical protein